MKNKALKLMLKENKELLRGRDLIIIVGRTDIVESYTTLREFGLRIIELDERGWELSFEDSLTKVRALYKGFIHVPTLEERTAEIKAFGTAA